MLERTAFSAKFRRPSGSASRIRMTLNMHRSCGSASAATKNVSLDQIICDPELAKEFDEFAKLLAPGKHSPLEYRWVALGMRKAGKLPREKAAAVEAPSLTHLSSIATSLLPKTGGLYLFSIGEQPVFLSQTDSIRQRIERHMDVSNSRGLPEWLWDRGPLELSIAEMPGVVRTGRVG